jgi:glycine oxidase
VPVAVLKRVAIPRQPDKMASVRTYDVAIIGGGAVGASIAFELAGAKLRTIILERQLPGREASWAAAGMLSPAPHVPEDAPLSPLGNESLRIYPEFVAKIENGSGVATHFARNGSLELFFSEDGEIERDRIVAENRRLGVRCEAIGLEQARAFEPSMNPGARAAMWFQEEATVEPRLLMNALLTAARHSGVEIRANCPVTDLICEGEKCNGVVAGGERIGAKHVIVAAGCFSRTIAENKSRANDILSQYAPTRPVLGQMIALQASGVKLRRVLRSKGRYVVPRQDGRIVAGSTLEDLGFQKHVSAEGVREIFESAQELVPELVGAEVVETWAGLRPGTPDGLPILGPTEVKGLLIATGHYRNGILLAPITAKLIEEWITHGKTSFDAGRFSPMRFARETARTNTLKIVPAGASRLAE